MIEVRLRPSVPGCVTMPLGCLTLGVFPLLTRLSERHFVCRMDESDVETRSGKRIAWDEITSITRVRSTMYGATLANEYILTSPQGRISIPLWRTVNAEEVQAYTLDHVPPHLLTPQGEGQT